jgi:nondiscriminating glutamyl-tRNA synthetase
MSPSSPEQREVLENQFSGEDVATILGKQGWHAEGLTEEQSAWCRRAAALLGPQAADRTALEGLLRLIFHYDPHEILSQVDAHVVLSRYAARDALRQLASELLDPAPLTTERFNAMIDAMKSCLDIRGRELFHTLRLALAGRVGEGELDRVILLLDEAATANFSTPVKTARTRIIEFCATID